VSKQVKHLCLNQTEYSRFRRLSVCQAGGLTLIWKKQSCSHILWGASWRACRSRIKNIYWISDEDAVLANRRRQTDVAMLLSQCSSHYVKHPLGQLGIGTTKLDELDRRDEDCAAVPDLVAGALAEVMTSISRHCGGCIPSSIAVPHDEPILTRRILSRAGSGGHRASCGESLSTSRKSPNDGSRPRDSTCCGDQL